VLESGASPTLQRVCQYGGGLSGGGSGGGGRGGGDAGGTDGGTDGGGQGGDAGGGGDGGGGDGGGGEGAISTSVLSATLGDVSTITPTPANHALSTPDALYDAIAAAASEAPV
jgi:hypothetical protein